MSHNFLWAIDFHGCLFKLNLITQEWIEASHRNIKCRKDTHKRISSTSTCAWAISGEQQVCVCVFHTDLPIKLQVHCYENERWSFLHGWSKKSRLPTDRWHWSSKDGKKLKEKDSIGVPSSAWVWSGDWYIDESVECDSEGWQYAVDYPATYYKQAGHLMFVRRRRWARQREFVSFSKWITIPMYTSDDPFQDIAVGGHNLPAQVDGFLSVWAITFSGKVLFRQGVRRLCPEGDEWLEIVAGEINLVQISIGATGQVWGCTWDGNVVIRRGISHSNPIGKCWQSICSPLNEPLHNVAVGTKSIWALSKAGKVYFWIGLNNVDNSTERSLTSSSSSLKSLSASSMSSCWVEMVGMFSALDVGPNDQVWVIDQENRLLNFRTNVTDDEPSGHQWKPFVFSGKTAPEYIFCISSGACDVDATYFERHIGGLVSAVSSLSLSSNSEDLTWRNEILKYLCERNNKANESVEALEMILGGTSSNKWNKRGECLYLMDKVYDTWCTCHLKLQSRQEEGYQLEPTLFIYYKYKKGSYKEFAIPMKRVSGVHRLKYLTKPHSIGIEMCENDSKLNKVILSMDTENLVNEWMETLNHNEKVDTTKDYITLWTTNYMGDIYKCSIADYLAVSAYKWTHVSGHLWRVLSGGNGITWAIGFDGKPYVYTGNLQNNKNLNQQNVEDHYIYENQRWNPVEGYADRLLISDRWNWSDESGVHELSKQSYPLPSSSKWIGDWVIDYLKNADEDGWQYAVDFPRSYRKCRGINDYVRRRRWKRSCVVHWSGPWMEVKTDVKLCDISIDMESSDEPCCVWVVSYKGDVMVRNDVTPDCPQGTSWTHIPTETPVVSISAGNKSRVWCVRKDGSCYLRAGFQSDKKIGSNWFHVLKEEACMQRVYAGQKFILGLDKLGTLYLRLSVTNIYPEGTEWVPVLHNVSDVSVNTKDQVYLIQDNNIKLWINVESGRFETCSLITLLQVGWIAISCRSLFIAEKAENELSENTDDGACNTVHDNTTNNIEKESERINPYSVDIYSFYRDTNVDMDSILFEPSDSRVSIDC